MSNEESLREVFLEVTEEMLRAQLRAVRRLQGDHHEPKRSRSGRSQMDIVQDILQREGRPLHITQIIERAACIHQVTLDRESVVSALSKRIRRGDRFIRTAANTFDLKRS